MRLRLALVCALAAGPLVVSGTANATPCSTATRTVTGTIIGEDGRYVDAMLGFDLVRVRSDGTKEHIDGRAGSANYGCPGYHGYGQVLRVNKSVPATGSTTTGTRYWSVVVPAIVNLVVIEVYPKAAGDYSAVDESRYGGALRWKVPIPYGKDINIKLPLICAQGGKTGYIAGYATKGGKRVKVDFAGAWSMAKDNNTNTPIQGFKVGYSTDTGAFAIRNIPSGQYYTVVWKLGSVRKQKYNIWVNACKGTATTVSF